MWAMAGETGWREGPALAFRGTRARELGRVRGAGGCVVGLVEEGLAEVDVGAAEVASRGGVRGTVGSMGTTMIAFEPELEVVGHRVSWSRSPVGN